MLHLCFTQAFRCKGSCNTYPSGRSKRSTGNGTLNCLHWHRSSKSWLQFLSTWWVQCCLFGSPHASSGQTIADAQSILRWRLMGLPPLELAKAWHRVLLWFPFVGSMGLGKEASYLVQPKSRRRCHVFWDMGCRLLYITHLCAMVGLGVTEEPGRG